MSCILVVDDQTYRQVLYRRLYPHDTVAAARTYQEAASALESERYDIVQLDHDLGSPRDGEYWYTGLDVAELIAALPPERRPGAVILHSSGVTGPREQHDVLSAAGIPVTIRPADSEVAP